MLTDTHCHLNAPQFAGRVGEVLGRAAEAGVTAVVVPGWDEESSALALAMAAGYPAIYPAAGLHPWYVGADADIAWLPRLLDDPRVVAVGEIGLDGEIAGADSARQEAIFRAQLALAAARDLPVLLHCRRRWDRLLACLRESPRVRGVLHAFSGSGEILRAALRLGLYVSFGGMLTRPNSRRAHAAARLVPPDRLLLETDAPFMALDGIPAAQSEPAHAALVLRYLAALRGDDPAALAERIGENTRTLFGPSAARSSQP